MSVSEVVPHVQHPYVQLLGAPRVRLSAGWQLFAPDLRYQLLAYLACRRVWISREQLAALFWPELSVGAAKRKLSALVSRTRALEWHPELEGDAGRLRWCVPTDVQAFTLAAAENRTDDVLAGYGGMLLHGLENPAAGFSEWLRLERTQLHMRWREQLLGRAETLVAAGDGAAAAALLERLLAFDGLDGEALQVRLRALVQAGEVAAAHASFEHFAAQLQVRLGMEPTSVTEHVLGSGADGAGAVGTTNAGTARPASPSRVPAPVTSFVGRSRELGEVTERLTRGPCRLLTLTGAGGIGKTRVALRAAGALRPMFPGGVYLVSLDALASPGSLASALAGSLGLPLQGADDPLTQVIRYLGERRALLVLDNFEHLLAGAMLVARLLQSCPGVRLLVTSRERLNLEEEWVLPLVGLPYPAHEVPLGAALGYGAVELFVARAHQVSLDYALTESELPQVLRICRLVEGLPLGLELAAVWVRSVSTQELAEELATNLDLLSTTSRNVQERHRSVRAVFEHSWRLLAPPEQAVLRQLAVFPSGFRKEAAAYVAHAPIAVLAALVDKSLLRLSATGRYDCHPLLHQFCLEKLAAEPAAEAATYARYAAYFSAFVGEVERHFVGAVQTGWWERAEEEHDNLRALLRWAEQTGRAELGLQLAGSLWQFWHVRGYAAEGREFLARALAVPGEGFTQLRGTALYGAGELVLLQGDYGAARALFADSLALKRQLGDTLGAAYAHIGLGKVALYQSDYDQARTQLRASRELFIRLEHPVGLGNTLRLLGVVAEAQGNYREAHAFLSDSLARSEAVGDRWGVAYSLLNLGKLACAQGDFGAAKPQLEACLSVMRELQDKRGVAGTLGTLGQLACARGAYSDARRLQEACLQAFRELGNRGNAARALAQLGEIALEEGKLAVAQTQLEASFAEATALGEAELVAALLASFAQLRLKEGRGAVAARLWGGADALRDALGAPLPLGVRSRAQRQLAAARSAVGATRFQAAWDEGRRALKRHPKTELLAAARALLMAGDAGAEVLDSEPRTSWTLEPSGALVSGDTRLVLGRKTAACLVYLALSGPTARAQLANLFWPNLPSQDARNNLRQLRHSLRHGSLGHSLGGDGVLVAAGETLALAHGLELGLGEPGGELLADFEFDDCPDFEEWLAHHRYRFREAQLARLAARVGALEQAGELAEALELSKTWTALEPLAEAAHRSVMRLYFRLGERAAALTAYHRCQDVLKRELDLEPLPETVLLAHTIAQAAAQPQATTVPALPHRSDTPLPLELATPPLLAGRAREWAQLERAWEQGQIILIGGPPGVGKTRLLRDFAASKGRYLDLEGRPGERDVPYAFATRIIRQIIRAYPQLALTELTRRELSRLVPELLSADGSPRDAKPAPTLPLTPLSTKEDKLRFFGAWVELIESLTPELGFQVNDDLHLLDLESLIGGGYYISRLLGRSPGAWRVLATVRLEEVHPAYLPELHRLLDSGLAVLIELEPLSLAGTAQMLAGMVGSADALVGPMQQLTGGNPLFIVETTKSLLESGTFTDGALAGVFPERIGAVFEARFRRLARGQLQLLQLRAVALEDFSPALAAQVMDISALEVAERLAGLEAAQLLKGMAFSHDLVYEAVKRSTPGVLSRFFHGACASFLVARPHYEAARVAHHFWEAGELLEAFAYYLRAAELALAQGAEAQARIWLERVCTHTSEDDPLHRRARAVLEELTALG